ncbi:MAG: hypothetical protein AAGH46_11320, partial [Bacteroidota bacterium]
CKLCSCFAVKIFGWIYMCCVLFFRTLKAWRTPLTRIRNTAVIVLESHFWIEFHSDDGTSLANEVFLVQSTMQQYLVKFGERSTQLRMDYQFIFSTFILERCKSRGLVSRNEGNNLW